MAEGAPLLRAYTLTRIEGSNPFLSASHFSYFEAVPITWPQTPPRGGIWTTLVSPLSIHISAASAAFTLPPNLRYVAHP